MPAKVICMASAKGGSGKTVLTATFAAFLCGLGKNVLMIDTDAATNGLTLMFLKEARLQAEVAASQRRRPLGIYEGDTKERREIIHVPFGADLVPATYSFINSESVDINQFASNLHHSIQASRDKYDYIFLDAQAGSDHFAFIAMSQDTSDEVIIVSEYDPLSAAGIERLKGLFREDLTYVRTWILLNKMLPEFVRSFSDFMEVAKYASPIPWDADVVRAYAKRKLALDFENGNEFTLAIVQALRSIFGEDIEEALDTWLNSRVAALREPIKTQYHDVELRLESLLRQRAYIRQRNTLAKNKKLLFAAIPVSASAFAFAIGYRFMRQGLIGIHWPLTTPVLAEIGIVMLVALSSYVLLLMRGNLNSDPEWEVSDSRIERQLAILQDRLAKLEALKSADVEVLVKNRAVLKKNYHDPELMGGG